MAGIGFLVAMAASLAGGRLLESALACVLSAFAPLVLLALADAASAGALLLTIRRPSAAVLVPVFFCLGAAILYTGLLKTKAVLKYLSVWGLIALAAFTME